MIGVDGVSIPGILRSTLQPRGPNVLPLFEFDLGETVFTPGMAKRLSAGPFETAPIIQGDLDGTGVPDIITYPRGDALGNAVSPFFANIDQYQGSIVFWLTPEWDGDDGVEHRLSPTTGVEIRKTTFSNLRLEVSGVTALVEIDVSAWNAGDTHLVVGRWDSKSALDGTNFSALSIDNASTFGKTSTWDVAEPSETQFFGARVTSTLPANAIIEGLTIYRRPLFDGTYGTDVGNGDELTQIYNAGAGVDPTTITGSWDVVTCIPTDSTAGELVTGPGNAWSHSHGASLPDDTFMSRGGYLGGPYSVVYNGTSTRTDCGADASLNDLGSGAEFNVDVWVRTNVASSIVMRVVSKGNSTGWIIEIGNTGKVRMLVFLAGGLTLAESTTSVDDGKAHLISGHYDDATKTASIAVDGIWEDSDVGAGAWLSDAAINLFMGRHAADITLWLNGALGWIEISDNDRHTAGTDFIRPLTPFNDINTIELWLADEGTGALLAAQVNGANDGTITNGAWSSEWDLAGTPVVPQGYRLDGSATIINCASDVSTDDIPSGAAITVGAWVRVDVAASNAIAAKGSLTTEGWTLRVGANGVIQFVVALDGANANALTGVAALLADKIWHFVHGHYDDTTKVASVGIDGFWLVSDTGAGNYVSDAAQILFIGKQSGSALGKFNGAIGRVRLSDNDRLGASTGNPFVPPSRVNHPAADGNTVEQWNFVDGAGTTLTAIVNGANDGTITPGAGGWLNTIDMEEIEPGARVYAWGYEIGSDGVDDGLVGTFAVTEETDYVIRTVVSYGQSGRGWPQIYIFDNTNVAQIGADYNLPRVSDVHTGANGSATLINANGSFTQQLVGWECYNVTDGSSGTITAVSGDKTTITVTLAGGTDDDFDTGDTYIFRPPNSDPYSKHPCATESIFVFRTPTGCLSIDIEERNNAGEGVLQWQQCEILASLLENGDHESLTGGNPDLITGWVNSALDAGDTEAEAVIVHSGTQSLEWNVGAAGEGMNLSPVAGAIGTFVAYGLWTHGDGTSTLGIRTNALANGVLQFDPTNRQIDGSSVAAWNLIKSVWRIVGTMSYQIRANVGAVGDRFSDDAFGFQLDPITLTVTPASEANSLEGTGIRVDGFDSLTQAIPVGTLQPSIGHIRFPVTFRHDAAELGGFGVALSTYARIWFNVTNNILLYAPGANNILMRFDDGGGAHAIPWDCTGLIVAGTQYMFDIIYTPFWMRLYQDGIQRSEIVAVVNFANIPVTAYWINDVTAGRQGDAVIG